MRLTGSPVRALLAGVTALLLLLCQAEARSLRAAATASSYSDDGVSREVSQALGNAEVVTAVVSTNGGEATATQSADSGQHVQVTVAGTNSHTSTSSSPADPPTSWTHVPACKANPTSSNSVKDGSGRLWGYEDNVSCGYKDPKDHHPLFYWAAAPACPGSPGPLSTTDSDGRVWGWIYGVSCAYKPAFHRKLSTFGVFTGGWGAWGNGLTSFWQQYLPAASQYTEQPASANPKQPEASLNYAVQAKPSQEEGVSDAPSDTGSIGGPGVHGATVPDSSPVPAPSPQGTGSEFSGKGAAAKSFAQSATDGPSRTAAASAGSSAAVANNGSEVTSHAEAHALSSASSWSWSPETGNITHQAHSEAHATVDDVSGTAQASAFAIAAANGSAATAQGGAVADSGKVQTQVGAAAGALRTLKFAAPVDVAVAAVPVKPANNTPSILQGPSHIGLADPITTSMQPAASQAVGLTIPSINVTAPLPSITPAVPNKTVMTPDAVLKTIHARDPQKPKASPQPSPKLTPTSPSAGPPAQTSPTPAVTIPTTPMPTPAAPVVPVQGNSTALIPTVTAVSTSHGLASSVTIGTAIPSTHPVVSPGAPPVGDGTTICQLVDNGSGQQSLRCNKVVTGPPVDRVAINISAGNIVQPAAPLAVTHTTTASAPPPSAGTPAPAAADANSSLVQPSTAVTTSAAVPGAPPVSPAPLHSAIAVTSPSPVVVVSASPSPVVVVPASPSPVVVVPARPSPTPAVKHTITIIHDPEVQDSITGPDALSGSAPVPGSTTNGSEPIIPASGLSISDYYNDDHANDDLSKDVSPQIPGNTSHSGPTSSTNMASPLPLPAVNPAALNSTEPLGTEQTADQPVQDVSNKAAAPTAVTATSTTGPRPGTVTLPLDTPPAPAKADAAPTQSAWQQSSSPQPSSSSTAAAAAVDVVATSSENLFGTTWQSAPACQAQPNKQNSVQDATGRLWWWENGQSCAYRAAGDSPIYYDGYVQVKWDTSPACDVAPTLHNAMADANGRAWGWVSETSTNCKFVQENKSAQAGAALMYKDIAKS